VGFFTTTLTKLSLHFFGCFYDFLHNLQESAKALLLFQIRFCSRDPGQFRNLTNMPLAHEKHPGNIWEPAIGSLGADRRRPCWIPVRWRLGLVGRGGENVQGLTGDRLVAWLVEKEWPAGVLSGSRRRPPLERLLRERGGAGCALGR
jgi:hypothetical protein